MPAIDLRAAGLIDSRWGHVTLTGAYLQCADIHGADLRRANLTGADLRGVNLAGADLGRANLTRTDLRGAYLNLSATNLLSYAELPAAAKLHYMKTKLWRMVRPKAPYRLETCPSTSAFRAVPQASS
jgi:hypothetical protein